MAEFSANLEWIEKMLGEKMARLFLWVILLGIVTWGGFSIVEKGQAVLGEVGVLWTIIGSALAFGFVIGMIGVGLVGFVWVIGMLRFRDREIVQMRADIAAISDHLGIR